MNCITEDTFCNNIKCKLLIFSYSEPYYMKVIASTPFSSSNESQRRLKPHNY